MPTIELSGKVALVTGASRGIGAATALRLAAAGVSVALAARSKDEIEQLASEISDHGGNAEALTCDVSQYHDVAVAVQRCIDRWERIDLLVNNAGVIEPIGQLAESDPEQWGRAVDINYKGVYHGMRAVIPQMLKQGAGSIINISSGAAHGALEGWSHYCSGKAGAYSLTRCADLEYRKNGVRIMGLSPGTVATEMQVVIKASGVNSVSQLDPAVHISPDDVAQAIIWLYADSAESYCGTDFSLRGKESRHLVGLE